ncbi:MAG: PIN domain-containing protein [Gordonibacter sp.]
MEASTGCSHMKVLFDVNVVIDIWGNTDDFAESYQAFDIALFKNFEPCVTSSMAPSIVYLLSARKYLPRKESRDAFGSIMEIAETLDVIDADCRCARESDMADFEDALIAYTAKRHEVDFIVTRNKADFAHSPVPAMTPAEFVGLYRPTCLEYEMVDL